MNALIKLAWRNVWRKKVRSLVVIVAIALGLWAGVFIMGFYMGIFDQRIEEVINSEVSHLQVHHAEFQEDFDVKFTVPDAEGLREEISADPRVKSTAMRCISMAMAGTASGNLGIRINGINPEDEALIRGLDQKLVDGEFLTGIRRNPVLVSRKLADKLKLKLKSKLVLQLQDSRGEITGGAFRVAGIFKTINSLHDEGNIFVLREDLQNLIGIEGAVHEIAVLLHEHDQVDPFVKGLQANYPELEIKSWMDLSPGMRYTIEAMDTMMLIIVSIILLALLFGIVNTMLMAVLERVREIGMLMAVGMSRGGIFGMIMLETIFLALVGGPLGLVLGFVTISLTSHGGIDLSVMSETLEKAGYSSMVYPHLEAQYYLQIAGQVIFMALIAAIYPALRALKLKPVEALRKI